MLLHAKIKNVSEWKAILSAIQDIVDDAMFICNDEGITFRGMDPAHVALLDVTFPKSAFESLESETSFFGLRIADFQNIFNAAENDDLVELQIRDENNMKVIITGSLDMEYNLRLIEKTQVNTPIPRIDVRTKIGISPKSLGRIISNIEKISDHVSINSLIDRIEFLGKGDVGDAKIDIPKNNPDLAKFSVSEDSYSTYSLEYMAKIIRDIGRSCKSVDIEYGTKTPIHLSFEMPSMTKVEYYLAPKIDN